jgi:ABC-type nitrate/sulfonate/bicarbonate transport system substrate-binding protein
MLRGAQWFLDPAHREEAIAMVARFVKQPPERLATYLYTDKDYFHDPHGLPNLVALQHDMQTQLDLGFLKADLEVRKYTDLSFITEASKRLE